MDRDPVKVFARVIFSIFITSLVLIQAGCRSIEVYQYETHCNRPGLP